MAEPHDPDIDFAALMPAVARKLLGDPDGVLLNGNEWRYGTHGSKSIKIDPGIYFDHERGWGGGTLDLIEHELGLRGADAIKWLRSQGLIQEARPKLKSGTNGRLHTTHPQPPQVEAPKATTWEPDRIVAIYDYRDEARELLFQVLRIEEPGKKKTFLQRQPAGGRKWVYTQRARQVPYRLPELLERPEGARVYIVEGEKDADRLAALGLCATTNPGGASNGKSKWKPELNSYFEGADVVILPDNDETGHAHAAGVAEALKQVASSVRILALPGLALKEDVSDWLDAGGTLEELSRLADAAPACCSKADAAPVCFTRAHDEPEEFTAADLLQMTFAPVRYVVEPYLVEGLTILGGRPKLGKSWMALDFAVAVATGGHALGSIRCEQGDVLYLALEDNQRRLQTRLSQILDAAGGHEPPGLDRLTLRTKAGRLDTTLIETLEAWWARVADARLVIIDVLAKVRPQRRNGEGVYEYDYRCAEPLQQWAIAHGVAVVVVHHVRKAEAEDPLEMLSGSNGLSGAADTILVLSRDAQGMTLYGRGRDIEEVETAISRDDGAWRILGDADEVRKSDQRRTIIGVLREARDPMGPTDVATATGMKEPNVRSLLGKMAKGGEILKEARGRYTIAPGHVGHVGHVPDEPR
jgi:hypothetical protein